MGRAVRGCDSIVLRTAVHAAHESDRINGGACTGSLSKHRTGVGPGRLWNGSGSWDIRGKIRWC